MRRQELLQDFLLRFDHGLQIGYALVLLPQCTVQLLSQVLVLLVVVEFLRLDPFLYRRAPSRKPFLHQSLLFVVESIANGLLEGSCK